MTQTPRSSDNGPARTLPPPTDFLGRLRQVGPSLILTAGIVGSGELIVTTTLGARLGFAALWLILLSCVSKVVLQVEIGRYAISSGDSSLGSVDRIPGPRWRASWVVWGWLLSTLISSSLVGGIVSGVAQCLHLLLPQVSVTTWGIIACLVTLGILLSGGYSVVERGSMLMVVAFSLTTVVAAGALQWSGHALSPENVWEGLTFQLPAQGGPGPGLCPVRADRSGDLRPVLPAPSSTCATAGWMAGSVPPPGSTGCCGCPGGSRSAWPPTRCWGA